LGKGSATMRALLLPLAAILALATGLGLLVVAATVTQAPVVVVATATSETADVAATPTKDLLPATEPLAADVLVWLADGPGLLRLARLALARGAVLPSAVASGPTVLIVEAGTVGVVVKDDGWVQVGPDGAEVDAVLGRGERLALRPRTVRTVRNAGPA